MMVKKDKYAAKSGKEPKARDCTRTELRLRRLTRERGPAAEPSLLAKYKKGAPTARRRFWVTNTRKNHTKKKQNDVFSPSCVIPAGIPLYSEHIHLPVRGPRAIISRNYNYA